MRSILMCFVVLCLFFIPSVLFAEKTKNLPQPQVAGAQSTSTETVAAQTVENASTTQDKKDMPWVSILLSGPKAYFKVVDIQ
jgi:hypothetical protein